MYCTEEKAFWGVLNLSCVSMIYKVCAYLTLVFPYSGAV